MAGAAGRPFSPAAMLRRRRTVRTLAGPRRHDLRARGVRRARRARHGGRPVRRAGSEAPPAPRPDRRQRPLGRHAGHPGAHALPLRHRDHERRLRGVRGGTGQPNVLRHSPAFGREHSTRSGSRPTCCSPPTGPRSRRRRRTSRASACTTAGARRSRARPPATRAASARAGVRGEGAGLHGAAAHGDLRGLGRLLPLAALGPVGRCDRRDARSGPASGDGRPPTASTRSRATTTTRWRTPRS